MNNGLGMHFKAFTFPTSQKHVFSKMGGLPKLNLTSIPFPSQGNNFPNQFLAKIIDWHTNTKWVVYNFMGFPFDIWLYPIGSRVWIIFLPIPCEIMPPSLSRWRIASCGIFINLHFYMMSQNILCLAST